MRAVQHDFYSLCMRHVSNFPHGKDMPCDIDDVWHHQELGFGRNRLSINLHYFFIRFGMHGNVHFHGFDSPAFGCQFKHGLHGAIVLVGKDRLITSLPRVARNNQVQGLGRVSSQYYLFGRSTYQSGKRCSRFSFIFKLNPTHVM